jgi:hypothetical protein
MNKSLLISIDFLKINIFKSNSIQVQMLNFIKWCIIYDKKNEELWGKTIQVKKRKISDNYIISFFLKINYNFF